MTPKEITLFENVIKQSISSVGEQIKGEINLVKLDLTYIKKRSDELNSMLEEHEKKISELQKANIDHFVNCPIESRVKSLEATELANKSIYSFITKAGVFVAALWGILYGVIQLLKD